MTFKIKTITSYCPFRRTFHSDQHLAYLMHQYANKLKEHCIFQAISRRGNCQDNYVMENFFGILKSELFYLNDFESVEQLQHSIDEYIHYYNHDRIKLKLGGLSPVEYRTQSLLAA